MSYTAPLGNAVDFKFDGTPHIAPLGNEVNFSFAIQERVFSGAVDIYTSIGGYVEAFEYIALYGELVFDVALSDEVTAYPVGSGAIIITPVFSGAFQQDPILLNEIAISVYCNGYLTAELVVSGGVQIAVTIGCEAFHDQPSVILLVTNGSFYHGVSISGNAEIPVQVSGEFLAWRQFAGAVGLQLLVDGVVVRGSGVSCSVSIDLTVEGVLGFLPMTYIFGDVPVAVAVVGVLDTPTPKPPTGQLLALFSQGAVNAVG